MDAENATTHIPTSAQEVLAEARASSAGRAARTLTPGSGLPLTQTLLALVEGTTLNEHENPGAATLHLLEGRLRVETGDQQLLLEAGDHATIPTARHSVSCLEDAVALLTAVRLAKA